MTHKQPGTVPGPIYTGPGRTRPAPLSGTYRGMEPAAQAGIRGGREQRWVGPRRPTPRIVGTTSPPSQRSFTAHLPSGISTRLEGGTEMAPHGVLDTYVNHGCRCAACTKASREYGRRRARLRAYGQLEELVPLEQVAAHIAWLSTQGVGSRQIAQLANVGRMTVEQVTRPRACYESDRWGLSVSLA